MARALAVPSDPVFVRASDLRAVESGRIARSDGKRGRNRRQQVAVDPLMAGEGCDRRLPERPRGSTKDTGRERGLVLRGNVQRLLELGPRQSS